MNHIILIGRLVRDPELKYLPSEKAVCNFTLAVNRPYSKNGEQEADFINIQVWGKQAESCANYLAKGKQAAVSGRLQIRSYDGNDGTKKYVTEVVADRVEFLGSSSSSSARTEQGGGIEEMGREVLFDDNDLPF